MGTIYEIKLTNCAEYTILEPVMVMLFSKIIKQISGQEFLKIIKCTDMFEISDVLLIDGFQTNYINNVLYFGYYEQLAEGCLPAQCILVKTEKTLALKNISTDLALVNQEALFFCVNAAKAMVEGARSKGFYAELINCAIRTQDINPIMNLAASKLGNPLILLDENFKVLSYSNVFLIKDSLWAQIIQLGYCNYEFVTAVSEMEVVKNAALTPEPTVVTCSGSALRKLSSKILCNGRSTGTVLMLETEMPISSKHMELLPVISAAIGDTIQRYLTYLLPNNTLHQKLLYDLLIGASSEEIAPQIVGLKFSPYLCALCVQHAQRLGQQYLKEQVAEKMVKLLPDTRFTFHEGGIAALVSLGDQCRLSEEQIAVLDDFSKKEHLRIGISNTFFRIENFAKYYAQARRTLEILHYLQAGRNVGCYEKFSFYDLLNSVENFKSLEEYCHPALIILREYDRANNTEFYYTLCVYLECACSIKLTAEKLFIHRNSLTYRLERIQKLTQVDLADDNIRFLLVMSYRIDYFCGEIKKKQTQS
ncbi:hypothetical protein SPSIL_009680 [Sporomusa silvacetica DSM 10669]|uniref:Purine catabolism regulatory protein n=1 Tax=Sporomusa silvacetica DSM 10669 TaxID=1123289 RepID=A0ABZ3IHF6_9FIRM|nr:helix-turn-helix domain-containing protein [Sporomusa silvacetica]OZC13072.1 carbohydrate diacid regulator [Sporomusa silvacetica DSM 10669]